MDRDINKSVRRPYANMVNRRGAPSPAAARPESNEHSKISHAASIKQPAAKRNPRKGWFIALTVFLFVVASAATLLYVGKDKAPLDGYAAQLNFPLYYPSNMPRDYDLTPGSIKTSGSSLLIYSLSSPSIKSQLVIALQVLPSDFDATTLASKGAAPLTVPPGTLYKLSGGEKSKYMLTAKGGTLILINTTGKVDSEVINSLAASLQKLD